MIPRLPRTTAMLAASVLLATCAEAATLRCRVFAVGRAPAGDVYVQSEGKYRKIAISTDYVTPSFRTESKTGIVFYRKRPAASKDKDTKDEYEPFASCRPDGTAGRQLVFVFPGATPEAWSAHAKADDGAFPPGTRLVFNLSDSGVNFDFGGTKLYVKPKGSGLLRAAKNAPDGVAPIKIARHAKDGSWVTFSSSVWRQTTTHRSILLLYPVSGTEDLALTGIPDTVEPKDAEETGAKSKSK